MRWESFELEMLEGCEDLLPRSAVDYLFISTHTQTLHLEVVRRLQAAGYRIEVSSDFESQTMSFDGLVFASSPKVAPVLAGFVAPARARIGAFEPDELVRGLVERRFELS